MTEAKGDQSPNTLTTKWGLLIGLFVLPIFFLFAYLGDPGKGRAAAICIGVIMAVARVRWDLRKRKWFWATMGIMILLQAPIVLFVPWTSKSYPGVTLLPLAVLDYAIVYGCLKLAENATKRAAGAHISD